MLKFLPTLKSLQGFTLIELLVTIAILGILSVIGLATFSRVQGSARDAVRRSNVQIIANAISSSKNSDGTFTFKIADLGTEFPNDANAALGNDPSGIFYCLATAASGTTVPTAPTIDTTWCPAAPYNTLNSHIIAGGSLNPTAPALPAMKSWTLCANLETSTTPFCMSSLTR
ncbi:MAG: prepilin-type N-terminal cleavage/methylation domain-containing protein [Candidatus Daviesbacteria bacterium]